MKFDVWCPDLGGTADDAEIIEAIDAEHAATEWARWKDRYSAEYWIVRGNDALVYTRSHADDAVERRFIVSGRAEPVYSARAAAAEEMNP